MKNVLQYLLRPIAFLFYALLAIAILVWWIGPLVRWGGEHPIASVTVRLSILAGLVVATGFRLLLGGIAGGLLGALALSRVLQHTLEGVGGLDGASLGAAGAFLALAAALACAGPAMTAASTDPAVSLRE